MRPNVLVIVFDTARADALEPYGDRGSSPAVADLARRGTALDMRAAACWTVPSHATMFTGLLPRANGLVRAPGGRPAGCRPVLERQAERLLPEVMRRNGFDTRAVSTNLWLTPRSGFDIGFDEFVTTSGGRQARLDADAGLRDRLAWGLEGIRARADDGAAEARSVLARWTAEPRERPFFWFVNLIECHSPYLPPRPYNDLGPLERWRAAADARRYLTLDAIWHACAGGLEVPEDALARMRRLYARSIRYLDDWLAAVLEDLDSSGALDETLVIVTSDHGENLGEGGLMGHAFSLDDRLLRVPFVAAGPGGPVADGVRSLAELPRIVADAVELEDHPWRDELPGAGVAVAQFDPPARAGDPRVARALERWGLGADAAPRITTPITSATDGRLKLVVRGAEEQLFDLAADPIEAVPLDPAMADDAIAPLRAALAAPGARAVAADGGAPAAPEPADSDETRELEERMRLLGYQ